MSEPNNKEKKQSIESIKILKELNSNKETSHLYKDITTTIRNVNTIITSMKGELSSRKKASEEKINRENSSTKPVESPKKKEESVKEKESFAELFAMANGEKVKKEIKKEEPLKQEMPKIEEKQISNSNTPNQREKMDKHFTRENNNQNNNHFNKNTIQNRQNVASRNTNQYKQFTPYSHQENNNPRQNSYYNARNNNSTNSYQNNYSRQNNQNTPRPYNNFRNARNNNYNNQNSSYSSNGQYGNRPYYNNSNNGNSNYNKQNSNSQTSSYASSGVRNQNKALMGIIPRKSTGLTSATAAFATKERSFGNKKKTTNRSDEERRINKKSLLRRGLIEEQNIEERMVTRKLKLKKQKVEVAPVISAPITNAVITTENITVKLLSEKIGKPVTEIVKQLMVLGVMANINSSIDFATAELVAGELGVTLEQKLEKTYEEKLKEDTLIDDGTNKEKRAPIVTIVGHVDHGKTSLLDKIRKTHVTSGEAGGITQAIGAYSISWNGENITFIDTPGHEAFINMRRRGTEITDIAVLIVAGDDGVKPQTIEAIKHIKEAKAPMIVAITKIDKQNVDIERIKQQLTEQDVLPEEWGGDTIIVPISSVTGQGIEKLIETILLVAEMQELKCNSKRDAVATVIEARLDKNRGPVANVIVRNGTLKIGDNIMSGFALGKVRALIDDKGRSVKKAGPSTPVSVLGFDSVPNAGDSMQVVDEKFSKSVIEERRIKMAQEKIENGMPKSLEEFLATPKQEDLKKLNLIIKADNQGSAEAMKQSLSELKNEEVKVEIVSCSVGNVNENDIQLAKVSDSIIISFDTKVMAKISNFAKQNKVEIRSYDIIYKAIEDIEKLMKSMMAPKYEEKIVGHAEIKALFKISSVGTIAGCYVLDGKFVRNSGVRVIRKDETIFEGKVATLKREKDDVKEVNAGYECGIKVENFNAIMEGDILECVVKERIN